MTERTGSEREPAGGPVSRSGLSETTSRQWHSPKFHLLEVCLTENKGGAVVSDAGTKS